VDVSRDMASRVLDRVGGLRRSARGYLAGFGTSGSLLAVAALLFIVASAMVAFRGWPHVGAQPSPGEVVVSPRPTGAAGSPVSRRLAAISAAPASATAGTRGAARAGARPGIGRGGGSAPPGSIGRPVTASIPIGTPNAGGGAVPCSQGCGATAAPVPSPSPVQPVQQAVQQTTGALEGVVSRAGNQVGAVVSGTGNRVGSVVQQGTGAVSGAVHSVSPPAAGAVGGVGSGAAKTVTGATKTIAGALSGLTKH
jgi:hypothetical protein